MGEKLDVKLSLYSSYKTLYHTFDISTKDGQNLKLDSIYIIDGDEYLYSGPIGCMGSIDVFPNGWLFEKVEEGDYDAKETMDSRCNWEPRRTEGGGRADPNSI